MEELIERLSLTTIEPRSTINANQSSHIVADQKKDAIDKLIQEVLAPDLNTDASERLQPNNSVFKISQDFATKWNISEMAVDSHTKLACGFLKFPVLMLLNPAPGHEDQVFEDMVNNCRTLQWIETALREAGLDLAEVIILDACTLLDDNRLQKLDIISRRQAISEAYDVTQRMLKVIKPKIIISCQCSTRYLRWSASGHIIASQLCSSIKRAQRREVKEVLINGLAFHVVQAYHPSGFLNYHRKHFDPSGHILKDMLKSMYTPCAMLKTQNLMALIVPTENVSTTTAKSLKTVAKS